MEQRQNLMRLPRHDCRNVSSEEQSRGKVIPPLFRGQRPADLWSIHSPVSWTLYWSIHSLDPFTQHTTQS